jgi:pyroglutamyl-peptidase
VPTVLATGFGPFPPYADNPSWDALAIAAPRLPSGWRLARVRLDVAWQRGPAQMLSALDEDVRVVVAFGQADDSTIRVERFALNACDRALADVDGVRFGDDCIAAGGPAAYETNLPRERLLAALHAQSIAAVESHFAGGYLCNCVFYRLMHATVATPLVAGFVHVPPVPRMPLAITARAMSIAIAECVRYSESSS